MKSKEKVIKIYFKCKKYVTHILLILGFPNTLAVVVEKVTHMT